MVTYIMNKSVRTINDQNIELPAITFTSIRNF